MLEIVVVAILVGFAWVGGYYWGMATARRPCSSSVIQRKNDEH